MLPYSDEKAMGLLSTQWKYHDPANSYWTTVEECYTLMSVGCIHRDVPIWVSNDADSLDDCDLKLTAHSNDGRKEYFTELKAASRAREFEQETVAAIEQSLASNQDNNSLCHLVAESENQRFV